MQRSRLLAAVAAGVALVSTSGRASAQGLDTTVTNAFKWRNVGPSNFMGRLSDVQGIPSPSKTIYVAAAGGGIWKSMNNGIIVAAAVRRQGHRRRWACSPSRRRDTNIVWAGTGEPNSRNTIEPGAGVYKSTDGGAHWTFMGLRETQHIGRIQVDPRNANVVYVAALGPAWKAGGDRGLYKTTDGGATWKLIKAGANAKTGAIDVQLDPSNPGRDLPVDVGALSHAVLAATRGGVGSGSLQVHGRRRDVDGDQGQRISRRPEGTHRPRRSRAAIRRSSTR